MSLDSSEPQLEYISSFDGTRIAARRMKGEGTPLLIANAVGANLAPWRSVLASLAEGHAAISWDHRGLLGSGPPHPIASTQARTPRTRWPFSTIWVLTR